MVVEGLEPVPALFGVAEAAPAGDRDVGGHQHVGVRVRGGEAFRGHATCLSLRSLKYKRRRNMAGRRLP